LSAKAKAVQVPEEVQQQLSLLEGFRDLVHEGIGYQLGAKAVQAEASEKTKDQRTTSNAARKNISDHLEEWITDANIAGYKSAVEDLTAKRKALSEAMKPFNGRKAPLTKAWKYMVNVAIPDSLRELGSPVAPSFSLSDWIKEATAKKKK